MFNLSLSFQLPGYPSSKQFLNTSFHLSQASRDFQGNQLLQVHSIVTFAFSAQYILLTLVLFGNVLYYIAYKEQEVVHQVIKQHLLEQQQNTQRPLMVEEEAPKSEELNRSVVVNDSD